MQNDLGLGLVLASEIKSSNPITYKQSRLIVLMFNSKRKPRIFISGNILHKSNVNVYDLLVQKLQ